jgi:hypothetical protein
MNSEGSVIFVLQGTGTGGSRITFATVFHYTITATGVETSFDKTFLPMNESRAGRLS